MLRTFGIVAMTNAAYYLTFTYIVERRNRLPGGGSGFLLANTLSLVVVLCSKGFGGWLSDRIGRRRLMLILTFTAMAFVYPALAVMTHGTLVQFSLAQMVFAVPIGMALGLQGAMVTELFPVRTRVTSMSVAYSVTLALAGGTAPLIATWLARNARSAAGAGALRPVARHDRRPGDHVADARDERCAARPVIIGRAG